MTTTISLRASVDAYADQDNADRNYGNKGYFRLNATASHINYGYLAFPLNLPDDATVSSATLTLYSKGAQSSKTTTVYLVTQKWKETVLTWTNKPSVGATTANSGAVSPAAGGAVTIDVTTLVQAWVSGKANYGMRVSTDSTSDVDYYSSEYGIQALRPTLAITYSRTPDAPVNLRPDGSGAVSVSKPLLAWDSVTPSYVKIELDDDSAFGSKLWDPGFVAQTDRVYDPSALTALSDGTTYYWRVTIKDENGVTSAVSATGTFQYRSQGTLSISAPSGATVTTTAPTVTWGLVGRTQAFYQVLVDDTSGNVYDSGRLAGAATSLQLPYGTISDEAETYTIKVRTWDTFDRLANGSNTDYVQTTKAVTLTTGAGTAPSAAAATTVGGHVRLTWTQTGTPDSFTIKKNGVTVVSDLALADALISGTSYGYNLWTGTPWLASSGTDTWSVQAETAGVLTAKSSTTLAFQPVGVFLVEEDSGTELRLLGQEDLSAVMGESGATFFPIGRRDPVRIVDSIRGFEGSWSGVVATYASVSAATALGYLYSLIEYAVAGKSMRLIAGHWNLPVRVSNFQVVQRSSGEEIYDVSFDFYQVAEFGVDVDL